MVAARRRNPISMSLCYSNCYSRLLPAPKTCTVRDIVDSIRPAAIRKRLDLSQERMARLLGVSFTSVNRWEGGHSSPTGPTRDLYLAIDSAFRSGNSPSTIQQAANNDRGTFLYSLFRMAYSHTTRRSR